MIGAHIRLRVQCRALRRGYSIATSNTPSAPPLLVKVRDDMKAALRAKDSARLDVLRGLIADTTNAAKTTNPVTTDSHMLQLIRKRVKNAEGAAKEAEIAQRNDLRDKELQQASVLETYIEGSNLMGEGDVKAAIRRVIDTLRQDGQKANKGSVLKLLLGPGGSLEGQLVDKKDAAKMVDGMLRSLPLINLTFPHLSIPVYSMIYLWGDCCLKFMDKGKKRYRIS